MKTLKIRNIVTIVGILVILFASYWVTLRPSRIKHDCSWVKEMVGYVPAKPSMNEKELLENGILKKCGESVVDRLKLSGEFSERLQKACLKEYQDTIQAYKTQRAEVPAKESWRPSTEGEYRFCLRDKGL